MAGHGRLQSSAQTVAVDGGDNRFGGHLDSVQEPGRREGRSKNIVLLLNQLQPGDIRSGNEIFPGAGQDNGLDGPILHGLPDSRSEVLHQLGGHLVHRGIVQGQYGHPVLQRHFYGLVVCFHEFDSIY